MTTTGGHRLKAAIRKGKAQASIEGVQVGYFADSEYDESGTPVAAIAEANEFGTRTVPERPTIRPAIRKSEDAVREIIRKNIDSVGGKPDLALVELVGETVKTAIQREISEVDAPALSPKTVKAKGSTKPLIDSGHLRASVKYRPIYR